MPNNLNILEMIIRVPLVLICLTIHEFCHGFTAYLLGDPTAKNEGRLTLNPLKHIDPIGAVMMLFARIGWAKAVPVNPSYFKDPKRGMAITALAGPISNLLMAFIFTFIYCVLISWYTPGSRNEFVLNIISTLIGLNIGLGVFNLVPIPPLDGSKVLLAVLPKTLYFTYMKYERYGMILIFALVYFGFMKLDFIIEKIVLAFAYTSMFIINLL